MYRPKAYHYERCVEKEVWLFIYCSPNNLQFMFLASSPLIITILNRLRFSGNNGRVQNSMVWNTPLPSDRISRSVESLPLKDFVGLPSYVCWSRSPAGIFK
jgi:hypothetical protein